MSIVSSPTLVHTGSHWGMYDVEVNNDRVVGVRAFHQDPQPSHMINTIPSAVHAVCRITQPMVRQGWLEHGARSDRAGRGVEPFVAVSWGESLDLVATELTPVRAGPALVYSTTPQSSSIAF